VGTDGDKYGTELEEITNLFRVDDEWCKSPLPKSLS